MDLFHGIARVLHGFYRLLVDVCRFYGMYFSFERHDLTLCLIVGVFKLLLSPKCGFGSCRFYPIQSALFYHNFHT
jgi:hypothetical protein